MPGTAHGFSSSNWEVRQADLSKFNASLVYKVNFLVSKKTYKIYRKKGKSYKHVLKADTKTSQLSRGIVWRAALHEVGR